MTPGILISNFALLALFYSWYVRQLLLAKVKEEARPEVISRFLPFQRDDERG
jgi:hypothetical protein